MSAVLAQLGLESPNIPPLPSAPPVPHYFFEDPIPGVVLLVLAAGVVFFLLNARGKARPAIVFPAILLVLAGAIIAVATVVRTDREVIEGRTRALVAAVAAVNREEMREVLSETLVTRITRVPPDATRDEVIDLAERWIGDTYHASGHDILDLHAAMYGPRVGRTQTRVRVSSALGTVPSWWQIDWEQGDDGVWRASRIECLWLLGVPNPGG